MPNGRVILLNGASSSGKTSLARALQNVLPEPYLLMSLDAFLSMLPGAYFGHDAERGTTAIDGFNWRSVPDERGTAWAIEAGPFGERVILDAMHPAISGMVANGLNVIIDDVLLERAWLLDYVKQFNGIEAWFVRVECAIDVLEARELARGDRDPGQARWQASRVHWGGAVYDVSVDTSELPPEDAAAMVLEAIGRPPIGFEEMRRDLR